MPLYLTCYRAACLNAGPSEAKSRFFCQFFSIWQNFISTLNMDANDDFYVREVNLNCFYMHTIFEEKITQTGWRSVIFRINLWGHRFSQNANQKILLLYQTNKDLNTFFDDFLVSVGSFFWCDPSLFGNFRFEFWKKRWPNKFSLNLIDLYSVQSPPRLWLYKLKSFSIKRPFITVWPCLMESFLWKRLAWGRQGHQRDTRIL